MKTKLFKIIFFLIIISTLFVSNAFAATLEVEPTSYDFGKYETTLIATVKYYGFQYNVFCAYQTHTSFWIDIKPRTWYFDSWGDTQDVVITIDRSRYTPGRTYTETITFQTNTSPMYYADLDLSMTVPYPPNLSVSPGSYDFGESGTSCQFTVKNTGEGTLNWSATPSSSWLSLFSSGGSLGPGASQSMTAMVNRGGLSPGTYTGTISFTSNGGSKSVPVSMIVPDNIPPTGTISINGGAAYTGSTSVTLTLSASDVGSGVSKMKFSNDGGVWSSEEDYATSKSWALTAGDGLKTVYVQYKDNAGNWSTPPLSISDTIVLDTTSPTGIISINGGAAYTGSTSVTLTLSASDVGSGVSKMKFSNDGVVWYGEENYATSKSWILTIGDETKTVYVKYKDNAGNWSASINDTIILDTIPPTGTISINGGAAYTDSTSVTLALPASDSSGVSKMKFSNDGGVWSSEESYAMSKTWTLTAGDGTKTVYVKYKDNAGNWSGSISDTIVLDTIPPTGTISINNGDEYTGFTSVTLTLSASDSSGISKMQFSNDGVVWSGEESYVTSKTWTLTAGDETKTVYVKYKDNAGNWSASISDTIILDTIPPTGTISINSGDVYTSTTSVTLTLSASDSTSGVSKMKFSNDGVNWSSEEDYATSKTWTLTTGDEIKTVYVQYKDNAGRWSTPSLSINDTIILDTIPPTGTISINSGAAYTDSISVILTLSASDSGSGVSKMQFSNDGVVWSSEEDYATSKTWTLTAGDGTKTVYVQYKDNAGRWSDSINDTIVLDTILPTGTISINNGDVYTSTTLVTLTLSASDSNDVSKMKFSNDGANWSVEENYATSKTWTLTSGDGIKTVYVQYKDTAGNWSASISDTIILDATPPTGTISINSGAVYTSTTSVTLTLSASDSNGVSKMKFSNNGISWDPEEDYATSKIRTITTGDGIKTVYVQYKDTAGNWSASISDTIILDTTPPTGTISINGGDVYTDSTSVTLTLSASDSSGVSKMMFSNDGVNWGSEENYATGKTWTLIPDDGIKTVYVQYKDNAGRWSDSINDTIILETEAPTGTISINGGDVYTDSASVTLTLSASDSNGVSKMKFSNDGANWSVEEDYATSKDWTLTPPPGDGLKIVYVRYKDTTGNWSGLTSINDSIILDTTSPTGTISINNGDVYTSTTSVTLTLSASDSSSGVSKMQFSNDGANWSSEEDYATSKDWTLIPPPGDGLKTVYVRYKDTAGNWSGSISDTIILDTIPPTGTISINGGDVYANSTSVILALSASDSISGVSKMKFSNDGVSWSSEEDYAPSKIWPLTTGDGIKTVYVQYKDNVGSWSGLTSISDTIILDTTPPNGTISINNGDEYTSTTSVTLTLSASDSTSGVSKMKFSNDAVVWSSEEDYATSKSWTLAPDDGTKRVYVQYKDNAGSWSVSISSDTIILETAPPTGTISINNGALYTSTTSVTLTLSASDSGSGVNKMQFSNDGVVWSSEEDYATSKSWTLTAGDGEKTVYVQYKDNAGSWSTPSLSISDTIILDTTPPAGTISINNGADYTNSTSVTLTLSASDSGSGVNKMQFSNDGVEWSVEEDTATSKSWTLIADDGPKTVYVKYKDTAGNWGVSINDTIILDTIAPTVELVVDNDKSTILPDGEIVGVLPDTGMEAKFSKVMDTESVKEGLKLIAVRDNLNETINEEVSLNFAWDSSTKTARLNPQSGELKKNYLYSLKVTDTVTDLATNTVTGEREIIFRTIMDHEKNNVVIKWSNEKFKVRKGTVTVTLEANALTEDGYLIINTEPLTYQFRVNPENINVANEKSIPNGWYPIEGCLWEIKVCKENGDWMEDKFGSEVRIIFPYPYDEDKEVVENALIPLREETLLAFWLNEKHSNWVRVPGSRVDREKKVVVTGEVPSFSVFGLMGSAVYDLSDAHAYPVPWKPNDGKDETGSEQDGITFTTLSSQGVIKIYSISGELVREYDYEPADTGKWTWDVKTSRGEKVFSGVYIYFIKNEKEQKTGRLMIIR